MWPSAPQAGADEQPPGGGVPARIAYAGTLHRSLGVVTDPPPNQTNHTDPLHGPGPAHMKSRPAQDRAAFDCCCGRDQCAAYC